MIPKLIAAYPLLVGWLVRQDTVLHRLELVSGADPGTLRLQRSDSRSPIANHALIVTRDLRHRESSVAVVAPSTVPRTAQAFADRSDVLAYASAASAAGSCVGRIEETDRMWRIPTALCTSAFAGGAVALGASAAGADQQPFAFAGGAQAFVVRANVCQLTITAFGGNGDAGFLASIGVGL